MVRFIQVMILAVACMIGVVVYDDFKSWNHQAVEAPPSKVWSRCQVTVAVVNNDYVCPDVDYSSLYSNL